MEVYIDNIVVKSKTWSEHAQLLEKIFLLIRTYNIKLNLTKCVFGVNAGKFLGFMVTQRGIEVNPHQTKVILKTPTPSRKNELQHFTSRLVTLGRFIAETRYSIMKQMALTLKNAAQKLRPYFQVHQVIIVTNQPLISILHKLNLFGRMLKWAIELSKYGIKYPSEIGIEMTSYGQLYS